MLGGMSGVAHYDSKVNEPSVFEPLKFYYTVIFGVRLLITTTTDYSVGTPDPILPVLSIHSLQKSYSFVSKLLFCSIIS